MSSRPGYFNHLGFGGIFGRVFEILLDKDVSIVLYKISASIMIPFLLIMAPIMEILSRSISMTLDEAKETDQLDKYMKQLFPLQLIHICGVVISYNFAFSGITQAVAESYLGLKPTSLACLKTGAKWLGSILCTIILGFGLFLAIFCIIGILGIFAVVFLQVSVWLFLLTLLGTTAVVVFALSRVIVIYALVCPSIMIEKKTAIGGIRRAFELADGRLLESFAPIFVYYLFVTFLVFLLKGIFLGSDPMLIYSGKGVVVTSLPDAVLLPFWATLDAVIYFNLRISKEGMNATVLAGDILPDSAGGAYKHAHVNGEDFTETSLSEDDELV
jgi:hypothetical protein